MPHPYDCISQFIFAETHISPADVILVPGGSQPQLMEKAVFLYSEGMAPYILPSGGANPRVSTTEWAFLQQIGLNLGAPASAILKEDQAQNTFENAQNSLTILQNRGLPFRKVILVCKAWHSRRALLTYQTVFPKETEFLVAPVVDGTGITKENWFSTPEGICRTMSEVEKIGSYFRLHIAQRIG
ncbi:YdcF family protein [Planomicrobium sp. CPCC 101079]|uniref:YdcF family protein n=1 Tax=Planomicrobium sp. CPCC 101079 TaxID=2599618 RepID=UPI0011B38519|nr:YdcF family protein [Planomicrobium sp. CPCC 101079]TWT01023.1 YdcF family protein [Planomicrobium sp. CPCC 101079]